MDDWIHASEAYARVQARIPFRAAQAICERANDGMIEARAERLIIGQKIFESATVHKGFWWARGGAGIDAKWETGDFETWVEDRHCRAYGVEFARADIDRMLPAGPNRVPMASAATGNYEPARRCLAELTAAIGGNPTQAIELIQANCRAGLIPSRCDYIWWTTTDRYGSEEATDTNVAVPDWVWEHCLAGEGAILNWSADQFAGDGIVDGDHRKVKIKGLQFDVTAIVALEGLARDNDRVAPVGDHSGNKSRKLGGRKLSEVWPDWIAELAWTLHHEGLPDGLGSQGQEEIIKKVADGLARRGIEGPSRTTVQPAVQAVLDRLRGAGN